MSQTAKMRRFISILLNYGFKEVLAIQEKMNGN